MAAKDNSDTTFLIVGGCGTIGLSTAWHLVRRGYEPRNIVCLDRWPYPSRSSAGYDLNKIVRTEYAEPIYSKLAQEAIEGWHDPIFRDVFHKVGWIAGTTSPAPNPDHPTGGGHSLSPFLANSFDEAVRNTHKYGDASGIIDLPNAAAVEQSRFAKYFQNLPEFRGLYNANAGWTAAADALTVVAKECEKAGVRFEQGVAARVVWAPDGELEGVETEDGKIHKADKVILSMGAYTDSVFDMEGQTIAVAYSATHVQMTPEEVREHEGMPVIDIEGYGYTFPPNKDGIIKFCDLAPGHPWRQPHPHRPESEPVSIPRDGAYHPTDTLSEEDRALVRRFIRFCMPKFADRPFLSSRMCWDLESFDYHWIISPHPSSDGHLFIATAGSGHTFKNLPNVGKYVVDCIEGKLSEEHREAWRWRPDKVHTAVPVPRVDLKELHGWRHDGKEAEH